LLRALGTSVFGERANELYLDQYSIERVMLEICEAEDTLGHRSPHHASPIYAGLPSGIRRRLDQSAD